MSDYQKEFDIQRNLLMTNFIKQYQTINQLRQDVATPIELDSILDQFDFAPAMTSQPILTSQDFIHEYNSLLNLPNILTDLVNDFDAHLVPEPYYEQALERYACYKEIRFQRLPLLPEMITHFSYQDIFINYFNKAKDCPKNLIATLKRRRTILLKKLRYRAILECYLQYLSTILSSVSSYSVDLSTLFANELYTRKLVNSLISNLGYPTLC